MSDDIYRRAIELLGFPSQLRQLQEECAELVVAVSHVMRGRCTNEDLASEVADVLIMCEQAALMLPEGMVAEVKRAKLERLAARLEVSDE